MAGLLSLSLAAEPSSAFAPPTFCVEWIRQSREGYERLTLFADRALVWKTSRGGAQEVRRRTLPEDELEFYCGYFARAELWELPGDLRSGLTGDFVSQSEVTLTRLDGKRKRVRFDEMSALSSEAGALRAALEGLKQLFTSPIAPASRFAPQALPPGTLLTRFDGVVFRVRMIDAEKGIVELEGVREPYREFKKIEELRFQFSPPQ